jgi:hypothetical protein
LGDQQQEPLQLQPKPLLYYWIEIAWRRIYLGFLLPPDEKSHAEL